MDGLPAETAEVLGELIAQSEAHRGEQMAHLHTLSGRGDPQEVLQVSVRSRIRSQPCVLAALTCTR